MDIHIFALAFVAALYPMVVLVKGNPLVYLCGNFWRRTKGMHTSTQPAQIHFALKEGQIIVGADVLDKKNYE